MTHAISYGIQIIQIIRYNTAFKSSRYLRTETSVLRSETPTVTAGDQCHPKPGSSWQMVKNKEPQWPSGAYCISG